MAIPNVATYLSIAGGAFVDVSVCVAADSSFEPTSAIESPSETNTFVVPDVQIKLNDGAAGEFQRSWLSGILPESTDYRVLITVEGVPIFRGFILPNTIQFNDVERWTSFTAIGDGGLLARTAADSDPFLKRTVNPNWRVYEAGGNEFLGTVIIENTAGPQALCEILAGDTITVQTPGGQTDELVVQGVAPTTDASPYAYFELTVTGLQQAYEAGSVVTLITPYVRNIAMQTLVTRLFLAAGLSAPTVYNVAPLTGATAPFATPPSNVGLEGLTPLGVSTYVTDMLGSEFPGSFPILGTNIGVWKQDSAPTGPWTFYEHADTALYPVDWRPYGSGKWNQYGRRYRQALVRDAETPPNITGATYTFWAYDYYSTAEPVTYTRYRMEIEVDNYNGQAAVFNWERRLYKEESGDGYQWTTVGGPYSTVNGTTSTNLHREVPLTCGIDMMKVLGVKRIFFTEPDDTVDPCQYYVSQMTTAGVVTRNVGPSGSSIRGNVFQYKEGYLAVVRRDTARADIPTLFILAEDGAGIALLNSTPIPADIQPFTIRYNAGDGYWYALSASPANGVKLLSFTTNTLALRAGWAPPSLFPPSGSLGSNVDMTVVNGPAGTTYPMLAIFGNQLWWISLISSGWIAYADLDGLSCSDALAQLATLVDGYYYVDADRLSYFRSRSSSSNRSVITGTAATSTRLDDEACMTFRRSSVWYKSYRHVRVEHESDETIFGEAGDENFRDTEQALVVSTRFVTTQSFAAALAQHLLAYLGRALAVVELEKWADARRCEIGRTFTASVNGVVKTFQIIENADKPLAGTIRVQGLEM